MAAVDIQVANPANLAKIESFLNDPSYKEIIENSSTFNTRLSAERRMRMPFIDTQTGVAQTHCNLFMTRSQRMPGSREGQVYSYPSQRWRKARRQYLTMSSHRWGWGRTLEMIDNVGEGDNSSGIPGEVMGGDDSKDGSQTATKDDPKEWFYDEIAIDEMETGEDPDPESDEDYYDDTYANRRKRRGGIATTGPGSRGGRVRKPEPEPPKRGRAGRGRKRAPQCTLPYEVPGDAEKPYGCELCGAKYKTRAGLTYHYTHTHKESAGSDGDSRDSRAGATPPPPGASPAPAPASASASAPAATSASAAAGAAAASGQSSGPATPATEYQDSYVTFLNNPAGAAAPGAAAPPARRPTPPPRPASADTSSSDSASADKADKAPAPAPAPATASAAKEAPAEDKEDPVLQVRDVKAGKVKASPSPYCDFCLGYYRENKKTGGTEELVSCSDCGRSGHPTCLQFTANMTVSVRKYRWQCIECKCCSVCGTSDNDDQLLFCDDCDRGYHMYCLAPALETPPEGSWSCALCIKQFHSN